MRAALERAAAMLYPQRMCCCLCRRPLTAGEGALCETCEETLAEERLKQPALTLAELTRAARWPAALAAEALENPPVKGTLSAFGYEGAARTLTLRMKFGGAAVCALPLAEAMTRLWAEHADAEELIVPVPLHPMRERARGFNQAALLGELIAGHTGLEIAHDALHRRTHTKPQTEQRRLERLRNVRGAFEATARAAGRKVLLIDDVLTTGATALACAEALREQGATRIRLLTACRAE